MHGATLPADHVTTIGRNRDPWNSNFFFLPLVYTTQTLNIKQCRRIKSDVAGSYVVRSIEAIRSSFAGECLTFCVLLNAHVFLLLFSATVLFKNALLSTVYRLVFGCSATGGTLTKGRFGIFVLVITWKHTNKEM